MLTFFFHKINIFQSLFLKLIGKGISNINLSIILTSFDIISSDNLIFAASQDILHQNQMISSLNLISMKSDCPVILDALESLEGIYAHAPG